MIYIFFIVILVIISALLYASSFVFSQSFWWAIFIAHFFLFYAVLQRPLSFFQGYVWGLVAISIHSSGALISAMRVAQGSMFYSFIPMVVGVGYLALYSGLWFMIAHYVCHYLKLPKHPIITLVVWCLIYLSYVYFIDNYCFWLFDRVEGYGFFHPLLPLAEKPQLLFPLPYCGKTIMTLLLCLPSLFLALAFHLRSYLYGIAACMGLVPWIYLSCKPISNDQPPSWLPKIGCIKKSFLQRTQLSAMAHELVTHMRTLSSRHNSLEYVILPEGALCTPHACTPLLTQFWTYGEFGKPINLIFGCHRYDGPMRKNSLHWIADGKLIAQYDKRHIMFLMERLPSLFQCDWLYNLYFSSLIPFTASDSPRPRLPLLPEQSFVPYICSELFFNTYPDDQFVDDPILMIAGNTWITYEFMNRYYLLLVRLRAIDWQRDIVFVSSTHGLCITASGQEWPLICYTS